MRDAIDRPLTGDAKYGREGLGGFTAMASFSSSALRRSSASRATSSSSVLHRALHASSAISSCRRFLIKRSTRDSVAFFKLDHESSYSQGGPPTLERSVSLVCTLKSDDRRESSPSRSSDEAFEDGGMFFFVYVLKALSLLSRAVDAECTEFEVAGQSGQDIAQG